LSGIDLSADKVLDIAKTITTLMIKLPLQHNQLMLRYNEKYWQKVGKI
jgi:hypothetical protein